MRWRRRHEVGDPLVCREFVELVTDYLDGALPEVSEPSADPATREALLRAFRDLRPDSDR